MEKLIIHPPHNLDLGKNLSPDPGYFTTALDNDSELFYLVNTNNDANDLSAAEKKAFVPLATGVLQSLDPKAFEAGGNLQALTGDAFLNALTDHQIYLLSEASQYDGDAKTLSQNDV